MNPADKEREARTMRKTTISRWSALAAIVLSSLTLPIVSNLLFNAPWLLISVSWIAVFVSVGLASRAERFLPMIAAVISFTFASITWFFTMHLYFMFDIYSLRSFIMPFILLIGAPVIILLIILICKRNSP